MEVVAALGASHHAPLLLAHLGGLAVAAALPPDALRGLGATPNGLLPCAGTVQVGGRTLGVYPLHTGSSVTELCEQWPKGLPGPLVGRLVRTLTDLVTALEPVGLVPSLREDDIRMDRRGEVRVTRCRTGEAARALEAISELAERLAAPSADTGQDGETRDALPPLPSLPRAEYPTTLTVDATAPSAPPPKLVVARISVLVLALGVAAGWFLAPRGLPSPVIHVEGASGVQLTCASAGCEVRASFGAQSLRGVVDAPLAGRYVCIRESSSLACTATSP